jgi:hypothetical protein
MPFKQIKSKASVLYVDFIVFLSIGGSGSGISKTIEIRIFF